MGENAPIVSRAANQCLLVDPTSALLMRLALERIAPKAFVGYIMDDSFELLKALCADLGYFEVLVLNLDRQGNLGIVSFVGGLPYNLHRGHSEHRPAAVCRPPQISPTL
jgi:hypothetical protein